MTDQARQQRREIRIIQKEAVWLQKAAFALQKAEDARDKLADARGEEPEPLTLTVDGQQVSLEGLGEALQERTQNLLERVRERRRDLR